MWALGVKLLSGSASTLIMWGVIAGAVLWYRASIINEAWEGGRQNYRQEVQEARDAEEKRQVEAGRLIAEKDRKIAELTRERDKRNANEVANNPLPERTQPGSCPDGYRIDGRRINRVR